MRRYKAGMDAITADEVLREKIMKRVRERSGQRKSFVKAGIFLVATSMCLLIGLFAISYYQDSNKTSELAQPQAEFNGIYITAFNMDGSGSQTIVKPNIAFGRYSLIMSSAPGLPLKIDSMEADRIHLQASIGSFFTWLPETSESKRGIDQGIDISSGDTVYWSPDYSDPKKSVVVITAYSKNKELGSKTIEISKDEAGNYTGMLVE